MRYCIFLTGFGELKDNIFHENVDLRSVIKLIRFEHIKWAQKLVYFNSRGLSIIMSKVTLLFCIASTSFTVLSIKLFVFFFLKG